jgi:hypothetical protein
VSILQIALDAALALLAIALFIGALYVAYRIAWWVFAIRVVAVLVIVGLFIPECRR